MRVRTWAVFGAGLLVSAIAAATVLTLQPATLSPIPSGDSATMTGYSGPLAFAGAADSITRRLSPTAGDDLASIIDRLPVTANPGCRENSTVYSLTFVGKGGTYVVVGYSCAGMVVIGGPHRNQVRQDYGCRLDKVVKRLLPPTAAGSKRAFVACRPYGEHRS